MDETFVFVGNPAGSPGNAESFDGEDGNDTLDAFFDGETAAAPIVTDFTDNGDGTFSATYRSTQGGSVDSVTITNIENVEIFIRGAYGANGSIQVPSNDIIRTGHGDDRIETGGGNDIIDSGRGVDYVDGGGGPQDVISKDFSDVSADILWDLPANTFSGPGTFLGLEAFGVLRTGAGNDQIVSSILPNASAAPSNEIIFTGGGDDAVTVLNGVDQVDTGDGDDRLIVDYRNASFPGTVTSIVNQNLDGSYSGEHRGSADGGTRTGVTFENVEHFTIYSASGSDNLVTGDGDDTVWGGGGNDRINVGKGVDHVDGGAGDQFHDGDSISKDFSDVSVDIAWDLQANTYAGPGSFTNLEAFGTLITGSGNDTIVSGTLSNASGALGNEIISTGAGNDTVTVANAVDQVDTGDGVDRLIVDYRNAAFPGTVTSVLNQNPDGSYSGEHRGNADGGNRTGVVFENVEHFTVYSSGSSDNLRTGDGDDVVWGGGGNDRIDVGKGIDHVDGGDGDGDIVSKDFSDVSVDIGWNLLTGAFAGPGSFVNLEGFGTLQTGSGNDTIVTGRLPNHAGGNETISTGAGNDSVTVHAGNDVVDMGDGDDRLIIDYAAFQTAGNVTLTLTETSPGTYSGFADPIGTSVDTTFSGVEHFTIRLQGGFDTITTGAGDDIVFTDIGNDNVTAGAGNDYIDAGRDNDVVDAGDGDDTVIGGHGTDQLAGGAGHDTLIYSGATGGVTVSLAVTTQQNTGGAGLETISGFEDLTGSSFDDTLSGDAGVNRIDGGDGNDFILGGGGDDELIGGAGRDTASYSTAGTAVTVSLVDGTATGGGGNDTLDGFEKIVGSAFDDTLTGDDGGNRIEGGAGNDLLDAGAGSDTAAYEFATAGVTVSLSVAGPQDTVGAGIDTLIGFEHLDGSAFADSLTGDGGANILDGRGGADVMTGLGGNDTYVVDHAGDQTIEAAGGGSDRVKSFVTYTIGANIENLYLEGNGAINGTGNALANTIFGNGAANRIDGGAGADTMRGGAGNDTYVIDHAGDRVVELAGQGIDTIESALSLALLGNIENLTLTGTGDTYAMGNELANVLTGNGGDNILNGKEGADTMRGGAGDDVYAVDHAGDTIQENAGEGLDRVKASVSHTLSANVERLELVGDGDIDGTGNALANHLVGNGGANVLDGGGGADEMDGRMGDDTYVVDHVGDRVYERAGQGHDGVRSSISYTLGFHVEDLTLTGTAAINGTGNNLANTLTGNSGNNVLNGNGGADTMRGGEGDDTYIVDDAGDVVEEASGGGRDGVRSNVSYTLGDHVEDLRLISSADLDGTGNGLGNEIVGNSGANTLHGLGGNDGLSGSAGDDVLHGGLGADTLHGGGGADDFVFDTALGGGNVDNILDMIVGTDTIVLDDAVFGALAPGALSANAFTTGTEATSADHRIVYDQSTGSLYYDADGAGGADAVLFATLQNAPAILSASDFLVI